jgi:hypothetical protein
LAIAVTSSAGPIETVDVVGIVDVLEVGLVENRQHMVGHGVEVGIELGARVHRPRRVVRVADVDDLRSRPNGVEHRLEVVPVLSQRHRPWNGAYFQRIDHVARERGPAADDLVAGLERELREIVDDSVGACAGRNLFEADVVPLGESGPQPVGAAVGIAVQLLRFAGQRLQRRGKGAERPLVRSKLDDALEPELALNLLDRLSGLVRDEVAYRRLEERIGDLGEAHAADSNRGAAPSGSRPRSALRSGIGAAADPPR